MTTAVPSGAVNHPQARYDRINPRVGVVHSIGSGTSLYGNLSSTYEPPTNFELEDNVAGGSAVLKAMHGTVAEFGLRGGRSSAAGGSVDWDIALYRAQIDDEILSVDDPLAPGTSLSTNVDRTVHAGIEAIFRSAHRLGNRGGLIEPLVTLTLNDFAFDGDAVYGNNDLPAAPNYFVRGELIFRTSGGYFVGPTVDRVGKRWADFANTYRVEAHTLLGLRAGLTRGKWRAFADVRNVTDEAYVVSHSVRNRAAAGDAILNPGEPLSAYIGFEISLD
jgi:iron complex outermembrane receptor protein